MASDKPIRVAIIGLGFGAEFIPIYQKYPGAEIHAICRANAKGWTSAAADTGLRPVTPIIVSSSKTRKSTPSTSIRRSRTTRGCRSRP